jgi:hypothetical protein
MTAARIVPALDEVEHGEPGVDERPEAVPIQQLTLEVATKLSHRALS